MEKGNGLGQLGGRISACRQNKNMTQEELAGRLGITPQALSKWERGVSFPDISMLADLCRLLGVSADYILDIGNGDGESWPAKPRQLEMEESLRSTRNPLVIRFGKGLVRCFLEKDLWGGDDRWEDKIFNLRMRLAGEGLLLPVVRFMDHSLLEDMEFMVLAFDNVLYCEKLDCIDENTMDHMFLKLEECVREKYYEILDPDLIKLYVDNLKMKYPALIDGAVPERIPYSLLAEAARIVVSHGNSIIHLPKMIEVIDCALWDNPRLSAAALADRIRKTIEREDNLYVVLGKRTKE